MMNNAHRRLRPLVLLMAVLGLQLLTAQAARAWWNSDWSYRMKITADAGPKGANIAEPIGRTQVLLRLYSGNFDFDTANENGTDLRLIAGDDKTPLHFHIERYDGLIDQVGLVWVDIPDLAPGAATTFYLYWGNKNATAGGDAKATYDPDQLLVYHFAEENGLPHDSTGYANNALTAGKRDDGGMIGYGLKLDGTAPIHIPPTPSLAIKAGQPMTWSMWVRPASPAKPGVLYSLRDGQNALTIGLDTGGVAYASLETAAGVVRTSPGAAIGEGWHHIAVVADGHLRIFVDGEARGDVAAVLPAMNAASLLGGALPAPAAPAAAPPDAGAASPTPAAPATPAPAPATPAPAPAAEPTPPAGAPPAATAPAAPAPPAYVGLIDEFEVSKVARPVGAFKVAVASQGPHANLIVFDVAEQSSLFGNGYVGIIVRSVTPDAWAVIGVLGLMALTSWWVMGGKALYISRLSRANRVFRSVLAHGRANGNGFMPVSREGRPELRWSSLLRLYEVGARELDARLADGRVDADGMLAVQSLAAIRSALDAALVQESQRLNRLLVLLTIAISGGPFLGLLGTVIGVMITFAAIASAGDVNVNAIAPGISAALLATVAGLSVAIPALFGYNYFVTRIRDATADMHVFVDELITRMGEGTGAARGNPAGTSAAIGE